MPSSYNCRVSLNNERNLSKSLRHKATSPGGGADPQNRNFSNLFYSLRRRNRKAATSAISTIATTGLPLLRSPSMFALEQASSEDLVPARIEDLVARCLKYFGELAFLLV